MAEHTKGARLSTYNKHTTGSKQIGKQVKSGRYVPNGSPKRGKERISK